jgi:hypothetical protein
MKFRLNAIVNKKLAIYAFVQGYLSVEFRFRKYMQNAKILELMITFD